MTLIKDLIEVPKSVQRGDFVLRLAEDLTRPDIVLRQSEIRAFGNGQKAGEEGIIQRLQG